MPVTKTIVRELTQFPYLSWDDAAPRASAPIRAALEMVLASCDGAVLTPQQNLLLAEAQGSDLLALLVAANQLRRALCGEVVTWVHNRNINFTNVCFVGCKFCAFSVAPKKEDAYFLTLEQVAHRAQEAWDRGATEVCIQGGLPHGLPKFYYRDILRAVKAATPKMHIHAFSPMEVLYGVELTSMSTADYLTMLRDSGLDTMPGTAAEILDDEVRQKISRNKLSSSEWQQIIRTAHRVGLRTTSTMMYGHMESPRHWVNQLQLFRDMQSETGGFTEFVPLGFIHDHTLMFKQQLARGGATLAEHLKVHALARVMLAGSIRNIQVSWVKLNQELSQLCLQAGANDYGGTLMDENISRLAGATAGEYTSPQQFAQLIRAIGRTPAERNTTYSRITLMPEIHPTHAGAPHPALVKIQPAVTGGAA